MDAVFIKIRIILIVVHKVRLAQFGELISDVCASFKPPIVFQRGYRGAFGKLGLLVFDIEHGLNINAHSVHVQTLPLGEIDKVELYGSNLALVLHLKVEPLMVATGV